MAVELQNLNDLGYRGRVGRRALFRTIPEGVVIWESYGVRMGAFSVVASVLLVECGQRFRILEYG